MPTHKITRSYTDESNQAVGSLTESIVDSSAVNADITVAVGTNLEKDIPKILHANMKSLLLVSSGDLTVKTNSSGSPDNVITLAAGVPLIWSLSQDGSGANPFGAADVTKLYCTNAGGVPVTFKLRTVCSV